MTSQVLGVGLQTRLPHSREVARVVPLGEGTTVLPRLGTHTFRAPGAQAISSVKRGVSGMKPQDTDGGCGTSPRCSLPRGRLYGVPWSWSRLCRGGAATGSWHHACVRPGPGGQGSREQPGRQRPGRGLRGQDPLGQPRGGGGPPPWEAKLPCPELVNEERLGIFLWACVLPVGTPLCPEMSPRELLWHRGCEV